MPLVNVFTCSPGTGGRSRAMVSPSNIITLSTSTQRHAATLGKHLLPALQFDRQPQPNKRCMKIKMVTLHKQMHTLRRRLPLFFRRRDRKLHQVGYGVRTELWTAAIGITPAWGLPGSLLRVMKVDGLFRSTRRDTRLRAPGFL